MAHAARDTRNRLLPFRARITATDRAGPHRGSGVEDGRKGHDGQGDVGDVIEKGLYIYVPYLLLNQGQRKETNQVGYARHHKDI